MNFNIIPVVLDTIVFVWLSYTFVKIIIDLSVNTGAFDKDKWKTYRRKKLTLLLMKFIAKRVNGKVVVLHSFNDEVYISIAYKQSPLDDFYTSYVHWTTKTSEIQLHSDGTVTKAGIRYFIKHWLPLDQEERMFMIFQGAEIFDTIVV